MKYFNRRHTGLHIEHPEIPGNHRVPFILSILIPKANLRSMCDLQLTDTKI
jgi:hypothetical protein